MSVNPRLESPAMDELVQAILTLKTREDAYEFLEDLCTISELQDMKLRWKVANMLYDKVKYDDIESQTGASSATISRVKRALAYGADGYRKVLEKVRNGGV